MTSYEDRLYVDLYSELIYLCSDADSVTKFVLEFLKKKDLLIGDGEIFEVSNYTIGDDKATVWFPDLVDEVVYPEGYWDTLDLYYDDEEC